MAKGDILLFGGSFDPIHHGHLIVARAAAERLQAARVVLIPAAQPPHKQTVTLAPARHRLHMARLAVDGDELFDVSDCELTREGPSYTIDTVRHFREIYGPKVLLYWLIGADSLAELPTWRAIKTLVDECIFVTAVRPGMAPPWATLRNVLSEKQLAVMKDYVLQTPLIEISATELRRRVAENLSVRYLTPPAVAAYIAENGLYRPDGTVASGRSQ